MSPFFSGRRGVEEDGFAGTFAKHPVRPRRGLVPGRRVYTTILSAGTLTGVVLVGAPLVAGLDLGDEPRTTPVARKAPVRPVVPPPAPPQTPTVKPTKPVKRKAPVVKKTPARQTPRKKVRRLPQGVNFTSVKGVVLKNLMTGLCAKSSSGGASVGGCDPSSRVQRWDLLVFKKRGGPDAADLFVIRNSVTGKCLDLPGSGSTTDTYLVQSTCAPKSDDNQTWYLQRRPGDQYWVQNLVSEHQCLDVDGANGKLEPGARLRDAPCLDSDDHQWTFL
ncbi:hypothetical protein GCM10022254_41520 [Actinomadura meridiana]|uniref:Ricin B lectin domain-containing protein n=1 Tax=Actinomadura meridiana TaxID=559626 RepID=A0ABP8C7Q0_9ACTN